MISDSRILKQATLTAATLSIIGFSTICGTQKSLAVNLNLPIERFQYTNGGIASTTSLINHTFNNSFTQPFEYLNAGGEAVSVSSPFFDWNTINSLKSVKYSFNYAFVNGGMDTFTFWVKNITTGKSSFAYLNPTSQATRISEIDFTNFFKTEGEGTYKVAYQLSAKNSLSTAGFNNVSIHTQRVPEPNFTLALLALGMGGITFKLKRKAEVL